MTYKLSKLYKLYKKLRVYVFRREGKIRFCLNLHLALSRSKIRRDEYWIGIARWWMDKSIFEAPRWE